MYQRRTNCLIRWYTDAHYLIYMRYPNECPQSVSKSTQTDREQTDDIKLETVETDFDVRTVFQDLY